MGKFLKLFVPKIILLSYTVPSEINSSVNLSRELDFMEIWKLLSPFKFPIEGIKLAFIHNKLVSRKKKMIRDYYS